MHSKKKKISKISVKKARELSPKDYNVLGENHEFMFVNPSSHSHTTRRHSTLHAVTHRAEKWILLVLLSLSAAAFAGFKLLEHSDMSFAMKDSSIPKTAINETAEHPANPPMKVANNEEFKKVFDQNRLEAHALVRSVPKTHILTKKGTAHTASIAHTNSHSKKIAHIIHAKRHSRKLVASHKVKKKHSKKIEKIAKREEVSKLDSLPVMK